MLHSKETAFDRWQREEAGRQAALEAEREKKRLETAREEARRQAVRDEKQRAARKIEREVNRQRHAEKQRLRAERETTARERNQLQRLTREAAALLASMPIQEPATKPWWFVEGQLETRFELWFLLIFSAFLFIVIPAAIWFFFWDYSVATMMMAGLFFTWALWKSLWT